MSKNRPRFNLQYLPLFWDDLNNAVSYIAHTLKAPKTAEKFLNAVETGILDHLENPNGALIYKTTREHPLPYYGFAVGNYMVFYVVFDNVMEVRRLLYGSRDLTRMIP